MPPGGVVSIQISYDPGWRAWVAGTPVALRSDGLGMVVIDPKREGDVAVRLEFTGGTERRICRLISLLTACALAGAIALQRRS